jgi:hypothetical protein
MSAFYSKKISLSANGSSENSKKSAESDIFTRNSLKSSGYRYKKCRNRSKKAGKAKKRR